MPSQCPPGISSARAIFGTDGPQPIAARIIRLRILVRSPVRRAR
ncbi:hypothetical protein D779_2620 [Imhoffiella purpurea]|uniref:Uncharacterized protein n=1 Tax=Imhoffiella purpurea TaxID=1249627 RepID=W9V581_9GAMM|nr:hypothetical protein D779_2620 [Imhoffiella purpurea]